MMNLRNFKLVLYLNLVLLIIALAFSYAYDLYNKSQLIDFVSSTQRSNIIVRDFAAIATNMSALNGMFYRVDVISSEGQNTIFNSKDKIHWNLKIVSDLRSHPNFPDSFAKIVFYYDGIYVLLLTLFLWIGLITFVNPLFLLFSFNIQKLRRTEQELEVNKEISHLAKQVAHDIRAPLSALNALSNKLAGDHSAYSNFIINISKRINSVAEDLLIISQRSLGARKNIPIEETFLPLKSIQVIIQEIYAQYADRVEIDFLFSQEHIKISCVGVESKFQQLSSNILQNAIESSLKKYSGIFPIKIKSYLDGRYMIIEFEDFGSGISPNLVHKIGEYGFSHGKINSKSGNGLGIYFAKQNLQKWGGKIDFISKNSEGVRVILTLKLA